MVICEVLLRDFLVKVVIVVAAYLRRVSKGNIVWGATLYVLWTGVVVLVVHAFHDGWCGCGRNVSLFIRSFVFLVCANIINPRHIIVNSRTQIPELKPMT
jgi:hypothetical protein